MYLSRSYSSCFLTRYFIEVARRRSRNKKMRQRDPTEHLGFICVVYSPSIAIIILFAVESGDETNISAA